MEGRRRLDSRVHVLRGVEVLRHHRLLTDQHLRLAGRCGNQSTLLLGIDKDTRTAYLYAVGHANGAATVIKGLGQVGTEFAVFADKTYFRFYGDTPEAPKLYGE